MEDLEYALAFLHTRQVGAGPISRDAAVSRRAFAADKGGPGAWALVAVGDISDGFSTTRLYVPLRLLGNLPYLKRA